MQKTVEAPQLQYIDKVLTVPVENLLSWRFWRWEGVFRRLSRLFFVLRVVPEVSARCALDCEEFFVIEGSGSACSGRHSPA